MSSDMSVKEILYDLVSVQSDTNTEQEKVMGDHILRRIRENSYFRAHPELCGEYGESDLLERKVIWALRRGKTNKTVILSGHYDAIEIDSYGALKDFALKPDELKELLKNVDISNEAMEDMKSDDWYFGRAMADMKAGVAVNLYTVLSEINEDVNVLFTAVYDEETAAKGIQQCVDLLLQLKEKFNLDYKILLQTEPHKRRDPKHFMMYDGSVGKLLPCIVAKGWRCHVGNIMSGLNPSRIMSGIINRIELNSDLCSQELGMITLPPTMLYTKDSKDCYEVTIPDYYTAYFNMFFFKNTSPYDIIEKIKDLCKEAAEEAVSVYDKTYEAVYGSNAGKMIYEPRVVTFNELEEVCKKVDPDYEQKKEALSEKLSKKVQRAEVSTQNAGIEIIKNAIEASKIREPLVVVGLLPPYVPPTNNNYLTHYESEKIDNCIREAVEKYQYKLDKEAYFMGLSDNSYTSCTDKEAEKKIMSNMVTPKDIYDLNFDHIFELSVPSIIVGPWGKDYHTIEERVYMPDVEYTVPEIIANIIRNI